MPNQMTEEEEEEEAGTKRLVLSVSIVRVLRKHTTHSHHGYTVQTMTAYNNDNT